MPPRYNPYDPIQGLKGLNITTDDGEFNANPAQDPFGYQQLLGQSHDRRVRLQRAEEDAAPLTNPSDLTARIQRSFTRGQQDMATGPSGWNRNWASFFEAPRVLADNTGMNVKMDYGSLNLPTSQYSGPRGGNLEFSGRTGPGIAYDPNSSFNTQEGPYGKFGGGRPAQALTGLKKGIKPKSGF